MGGEEELCGKCGKEISGKAMKAKDTLYHEEGCFVCAECSLDLREVAVYAKDAALYCEKHYKEKFVPKCARCLDYITEGCVRAMEKTWHATCFTCWSCGARFTAETGFHDLKGNPHCEKCYVDAACPKCKGCEKAITDKSVNAMGGSWHVDCFVCKECKKNFEGAANFYSVDDQPCCGPCAGVVEG